MKRIWIALLASSLATIACNLSLSPDVIVVTATPSVALVATQPPLTPTPIASPTPVVLPTATALVPVAITQANNALRNGDFDQAVQIYNSILLQDKLSVDPRLRADASFNYGLAALREGLFNEAVTALSNFIVEYPSDSRAVQAFFLRGDAYLGLSQWNPAIQDFDFYLKNRPGLIESYAYERIGDAYLALGDSANALANYAKSAEGTGRGLVPLLALREKVAAAFVNAGDTASAVDQYNEILKVARNAGYRASISLRAADLLLSIGQTTAAYTRYRQILTDYPDTASGYRAAQALIQGGGEVDSLLRGRAAFAAEAYTEAINALYSYTSNTPLAQVDPSVFLLLGQAYRGAGNTSAALTTFQVIITQYPTSGLFGAAWLEQGRTLFLAGQVQDAINKYVELAEKHPDVPQGAEALWRAGYLYSTQGDSEKSLATFEILGKQFPGTESAMDALFRGGMAAYNAGAAARALRFFSLLATTGTGELKAAGYLWLGRLYQESNQPDLARTAYDQAALADPDGYYSLRAGDLLNGRGPFVAPARVDWTFNTPERIAEAEAWMRSTFAITQAGALWQLSPALVADPRMIRAAELYAVAAYDEAIGEYRAVIDDNSANPLALYQLASYTYQIGLYREAIFASATLLDNAKIRTVDAPRYIAGMRFPIAYGDLVIPTAQKYGIDPLLVFSLIRQESLFEGLAVSSAQAQGLMQIIPSTGAYIASKLEWPDYQNSDLYRPHVNVAFGIWYLDEQLRGFDGKVYAALAAYNGGPGNSAQWFRISNGDPDLFLQAISFDETRSYVRRIYEQYATYVAIYGVR